MASRMRLITATLITVVLAASLALAAPAGASHGQLDFFEAGSDLFKPSTQAKTFAKLKLLGVHALRIELAWYNVAPSPASASKPHFEASNPTAYNWSEYASAIAEASRLKWPVLLTVTSPVPRWATSNKQSPYITRPDDQDFREFMTAVGRQFGSEVSLFAIWNEPNHPAYLLPQWNSNGTPASPRIYRGLWEYGYEGLKAAGIAHPKVLFGETAPEGYDSISVKREGTSALHHDIAPLMFLREALCLNSHYRRSGTCSELQITGYAHHAYNKAVSPFWQNPMPDDVNIGTLGRLSSALDKAAAAHAIPYHTPIYLTEFGVQSYPNHEIGVPPSTQAEYDAIDEEIAYSDASVAAFSQYLLQDDPLGGKEGSSASGGFVGFQTGLEYANGTPKPLYYSYPVPLAVLKSGSGFSLWGLVRPAQAAQERTKLTVLVRTGSANHYRTLATVTTNSQGYWTLHSSTRALYWRVKWKSKTGRVYEGAAVRANNR
jgi:hypothetical protein